MDESSHRPKEQPHPTDPAAKYAKMSCPRVHDAMPRPRLFARLDALRRTRPALWLTGPPGAGKSTLAASYLAHRPAPVVWFKIDPDDADPATWFFYLGLAIEPGGAAMPRLQTDSPGDPSHFARMFFREFYARLAEGAVVVLDNVQDFICPRTEQLLDIALAEVPDGVTVMALSRTLPPPRLAKLELEGRLATLGWDELRLDRTEAEALARLDSNADAQSLGWLEKADGWAAGITLLRRAPSVESHEAIFRYFTGEVFQRLPDTSQRLLLLLSCLRSVSAADAEGLTGTPCAVSLLDQLCQNSLFTQRQDDDEPSYDFHPLFHEFLQHEARRRLDPGQRAALLERAGAVLERQGRIDQAARLYLEAAAHRPMADLLLRHARHLLSIGHDQTWREWLDRLPPQVIDSDPWLSYWEGVSHQYLDQARGRFALLRAEQSFRRAGDRRACLLCAAAIIENLFYEWADFRSLPRWIEAMTEDLQSLDPATLDAESDLQIHSRLVLALLFVDAGSTVLAAIAQRALRAMPKVASASARLSAATMLLRYLARADKLQARKLIDEVGPLADDPAIGPLSRVWWYRSIADKYYLDGDIQTARDLAVTYRAAIAGRGLDRLEFYLLFGETMCLLSMGNATAAAAQVEQLRAMLVPGQKLDRACFCCLEANYLAQIGQMEGSLRAAREALELADQTGLPMVYRWRMEALLAGWHAASGQNDESDRWRQAALAHAQGNDANFARGVLCLYAAYAAHQDGDHLQAAQLVRQHMDILRQRSVPSLILWFPQMASTLASFALREQIEVDSVRSMIVRQRWPVAQRFTPHWPWPVAVRTLGKLELSLYGELLIPAGKAQQRPLMLLKTLIAAGGNGKSLQALAAHLWPDTSNAKSAVNVTVHRLRKLLGDDKTVLVSAGKIALSESDVWSDVAALTELCDQIDAAASAAAPAGIRRMAIDLLHLYGGPFCDGDDDGWLMAARERWRRRFLKAVATLGLRSETLQDWSTAGDLYARALDAEPLAETAYRGLMRCAHAQTDPAAAFSTYRRCRDTLSIVLGKAPSEDTEKLAVALGLKDAAKSGQR